METYFAKLLGGYIILILIRKHTVTSSLIRGLIKFGRMDVVTSPTSEVKILNQ